MPYRTQLTAPNHRLKPLHLELVEARAFGGGNAGNVYVPRTP